MYNIRLLNEISQIGLKALKPDKFECFDDIENPDAIILRSADMHALDLPESLLAIARAGAGTNNIPIEKCSKQGVVVFNTPGANANAVKELVMTALLLSGRKIYPALNWAQELKGKGDVAALAEKGKAQFVGPELKGKKLGVIGLGAIGILVSNMAHSFGMDVYGYDPFISVDGAWRVSRGISHAETLDEIYEKCDFISIHVPLTPDTDNLIDKSAIDKMKDGVRIFNFARADLVNDDDVIAAVDSGKVSVYATDFATDALLGRSGILVFPHLGASTPESEENCAEMAAKEIRDFLQHGNVRNSVNLPNVSIPRSGIPRITVFHHNKPNMLTQISGTIGGNINNLMNNSKGEYAYTILDVDKQVNGDIVNKLKAIEGVIRVRLFD